MVISGGRRDTLGKGQILWSIDVHENVVRIAKARDVRERKSRHADVVEERHDAPVVPRDGAFDRRKTRQCIVRAHRLNAAARSAFRDGDVGTRVLSGGSQRDQERRRDEGHVPRHQKDRLLGVRQGGMDARDTADIREDVSCDAQSRHPACRPRIVGNHQEVVGRWLQRGADTIHDANAPDQLKTFRVSSITRGAAAS